jgi:hypothetical protein
MGPRSTIAIGDARGASSADGQARIAAAATSSPMVGDDDGDTTTQSSHREHEPAGGVGRQRAEGGHQRDAGGGEHEHGGGVCRARDRARRQRHSTREDPDAPATTAAVASGLRNGERGQSAQGSAQERATSRSVRSSKKRRCRVRMSVAVPSLPTCLRRFSPSVLQSRACTLEAMEAKSKTDGTSTTPGTPPSVEWLPSLGGEVSRQPTSFGCLKRWTAHGQASRGRSFVARGCTPRTSANGGLLVVVEGSRRSSRSVAASPRRTPTRSRPSHGCNGNSRPRRRSCGRRGSSWMCREKSPGCWD